MQNFREMKCTIVDYFVYKETKLFRKSWRLSKSNLLYEYWVVEI